MMLFAQDDSGLLTLAAVMGIVVLFALAVAIGANMAQKRDVQLQKVARKFGGRLQSGSMFSFPELLLPHLGRTVTFKYTSGGENESNKTHLVAPWPNGRLRCEIFPEGPLSGLRKLIGMQDIEIGSPNFDHQFIITGNDEAAIKDFLTPEAQGGLFELLKLEGDNSHSAPDLYLQISGGMLTITKASYYTNAASMDRFIARFLQFYDAAIAVPAAGIEFLEAPRSAEQTTPHCIVCGEPLTADIVTCRSCRTPHHRECWQYFGGCATYACGGKQFVQPKGNASPPRPRGASPRGRGG